MVKLIQIADELGTFLQGRPVGRRHFARLCELLSEVPAGGIGLLDFAGVEVVSGSWINAALAPLQRWAADQQNNLFPVLLNCDSALLEELQLVADWTHSCFLVGNGQSLPKSAIVVGPLDIGQRATLDAVLRSAEVTGAGLERLRPKDGVKATAWNNRLKDLYEKRLIQREKRGREQFYSPVIAEVEVNG